MRLPGLEREAAAYGRGIGRGDFKIGAEKEMGGAGFGQSGFEAYELGAAGNIEPIWIAGLNGCAPQCAVLASRIMPDAEIHAPKKISLSFLAH